MAPTTPEGHHLIDLKLHYQYDPRFIILPISFRISHLVPYLEEFLYTRSHVHLVQSLDQVVVQFRRGCLRGTGTFSIVRSVISYSYPPIVSHVFVVVISMIRLEAVLLLDVSSTLGLLCFLQYAYGDLCISVDIQKRSSNLPSAPLYGCYKVGSFLLPKNYQLIITIIHPFML
ncbi:hypothetical protein EAE99_000093 [Botrytis elliptica]|nr:hypothetical protein EAE99_000093 [Botrytis elliptica]